MKRTVKLVISGLLVLAVMGMIFFFSSQTRAESKRESSRIAEKLVKVFVKDYESLPKTERDEILHKADVFVRKGAHVTEYLLLGITLTVFFWLLKKKWFIPVIIGVLYAAGDEIHQIFVENRGPLVSDVFIDIGGLALGIGITALIIFLAHKCGKKKEPEKISEGEVL